MKVWLDDERAMPKGFDIHVRSARAAIEVLETGAVTFISFDHDLGDPGGSGYDVAAWIEQAVIRGIINFPDWACHSANPVGKGRIEMAMESARKLSVHYNAEAEES